MDYYINNSFYLNSKFKLKFSFNFKLYNEIKSENSKVKKLIRIYSVGSFNEYYQKKYRNYIIEELKEKYDFLFTSENPDYLIYDVFNCEFLDSKYDNAIKIAFYTENQIPDFNYADYAIGFQNLIYLDRYFRKTTLIWILEKRYLNIKNRDFIRIRKKLLKNNKRKRFCAAVISNFQDSNGFRIKFIKELSRYKVVDMGGNYMNNIGRPVKNKVKFLSSFKFSIAMENSEGEGYISEKILDSFIAGTIPIYYGGYMVDEYINHKAYILIKNEKDIITKINYIKKIDNDDKLYKKILSENLYFNNNLVDIINKEKYDFFNNIFQQDKMKAKRIDNYHFNFTKI